MEYLFTSQEKVLGQQIKKRRRIALSSRKAPIIELCGQRSGKTT